MPPLLSFLSLIRVSPQIVNKFHSRRTFVNPIHLYSAKSVLSTVHLWGFATWVFVSCRITVYLQTPFLQISSHSEAVGIVVWHIFWGNHHSVYYRGVCIHARNLLGLLLWILTSSQVLAPGHSRMQKYQAGLPGFHPQQPCLSEQGPLQETGVAGRTSWSWWASCSLCKIWASGRG